MTVFKLSLKNMKKSFKDYAIYFLTLILGVAIFYVFNALDSQQAMLTVSSSQKQIMKLMVIALSGVSVAVAFILAFLIIYANNYLIKRRKKEFAVYLTLGMGKSQVSHILLGETIIIGVISLGAGLVLGVFASQFMSILVAKMFEVDMTKFVFSFSAEALVKTICYFGIMYIAVVLFNTFSISKYKLIDLLQAGRKVEQRKLKNSYFSVLVFLLSVLFLSYAYRAVTVEFNSLTEERMGIMIGIGSVSTYFLFWSLTGFLLKLVQRFKRVYYRGLNSFVLRQVSSNINTSVFSMTIICLLFFVTICVLSTGFSVNSSLRASLKKYTPVDIMLEKTMDYPTEGYTPEEVEYSHMSVQEALEFFGKDTSIFKEDFFEVTLYTDETITMETTLGAVKEKVEEVAPKFRWDSLEEIIGVSEYNKIAKRYGTETVLLAENQYAIVCDYEQIMDFRNEILALGSELTIGESVLLPQSEKCVDGFVYMSGMASNIGIIVVPDSVIEKENGKALQRETKIFIADYKAEEKEQKAAVEEAFLDMQEQNQGSSEAFMLDGMTRITVYDANTGLGIIATFIAIYLGIVFLIAGAALLALKELSESTDNKDRYLILNKIGADKKMQHRALLLQMGIFFGMPMLLAVIHSLFGIQFAQNFLSVMFKKEELLLPIILTMLFLMAIYGTYFVATYFGCKRIIEDR